jgi:Spy/CpxP family protein refolding chaperone
MKNSFAALILGLVFILPSLLFAQPEGMGPGGRTGMRNPMRDRMREEMKLTDQQIAQIQKLRLDMERKQTQIRSKTDVARLDIKESFLAEKPDRQAIEKSMKQVAELQSQSKLNRLDFWFSVNTILTADQQKVWKQHLGEMRPPMRRGMMHKGMMRGGMRMGMKMHGCMPEGAPQRHPPMDGESNEK